MPGLNSGRFFGRGIIGNFEGHRQGISRRSDICGSLLPHRCRCACSLTPIAVALGTALTHKAVAIELVTEICYRTEWELGLSSLNTAD